MLLGACPAEFYGRMKTQPKGIRGRSDIALIFIPELYAVETVCRWNATSGDRQLANTY